MNEDGNYDDTLTFFEKEEALNLLKLWGGDLYEDICLEDPKVFDVTEVA